MTLQEIYDKMYKGLASQGWKQSGDGDGLGGFMCYYRHPDTGMKCAVGWLIPDDKYTDAMEGSVYDLVERYPAVFSDIVSKECTVDLLRQAQIIHDENPVPDYMRAKFIAFGKELGLTIPSEE